MIYRFRDPRLARGRKARASRTPAQRFPELPMPEAMKEAACTTINADINQYAVTWGTATLRNAIAHKYQQWYQMEVDPNKEITVCCGATEAMASVFMALIDP